MTRLKHRPVLALIATALLALLLVSGAAGASSDQRVDRGGLPSTPRFRS